ncbi:DNA recombination protein RmuC [Salinibacterium sp. ZJ77]|uniref:DNA recombination protein RmuC n=1 Tax=Salinibacterium sp. ZJ77 TaxID=2708337 RepID=UPI001421A3CD|nr:DNA recombination protein RmuC [Salinibacterium sp. ZJ77]
MDALLPLLIGLAVGAAIATIVTAAVWRARTTSATAVADARVEGMREQLDSARGMYAELLQRTEAEARQRSAALTDENRVLQALAPVSESLEQMRAKVAELEGQRSRQHGEIAEQLRNVTASEERLRQTAEGLAGALRNNATRGVWGETQLRAVVEAAGMLEHVNFDLQSTISVDGRTARPDMIVRLPGGKSIAVDSKVPFSAYLEASAIPETADDAERARRASLLAQHVKAVRDHVTALGARRYWDGLDSSPEMVVAFIPSESLLSAALEADPSIMQYAFDRHVALASPVTLFSVLKAVAVSWRHEIVTQEARTLFDVSRELYGRITTLATHVDKLGRSIERSVRDYNGFVGSLERQVLPSARRLSQLDETKVLAPVGELDADVRQLAASELIESLDADAASARSGD